ncbi:MAG: FAD-dependent oxidoreductase [Pseudomonadota bacterium]
MAPEQTIEQTIGIVGAGVAGLTCAAALSAAEQNLRLFEKSNGLGGRLATRRSAAGGFDHGAPGFSAGTRGFRTGAEHAVAAGSAAVWPGGERVLLSGAPGPVFVGLPGASGFARHLFAPPLSPAQVNHGAAVDAIARRDGGWHLSLSDRRTVVETLVLAIPAPQAAVLLAGVHPFAAALGAVEFAPRLTAMIAADDGTIADDAPEGCTIVDKVIRQDALPGRDGAARWVIHATAPWSAAHIERDKPQIADDLVAALTGSTGALPGEHYRAGHRWRYALTASPLGAPCLWDAEARLALCGDWCLGDTVEDAWHAGRAAAEAIIRG